MCIVVSRKVDKHIVNIEILNLMILINRSEMYEKIASRMYWRIWGFWIEKCRLIYVNWSWRKPSHWLDCLYRRSVWWNINTCSIISFTKSKLLNLMKKKSVILIKCYYLICLLLIRNVLSIRITIDGNYSNNSKCH